MQTAAFFAVAMTAVSVVACIAWSEVGAEGDAPSGRRLSRISLSIAERSLLNRLLSFGFFVVLVVVVQLLIVLWWRYVINRRFYAQKTGRFVPFPQIFIWPNTLHWVVFGCSGGLTRTAVAVLAELPSECGSGCVVLSTVTLLLLTSYVVSIGVVLVRFRRKHGHAVLWNAAPLVPTAAKSARGRSRGGGQQRRRCRW